MRFRCYRGHRLGPEGQRRGALAKNPFSCHAFVLRGWRGDVMRGFWADGDGLCRYVEEAQHGGRSLRGGHFRTWWDCRGRDGEVKGAQ